MHQSTSLPTNHTDLVTDVAYDYYGERLATASADQKIKVWRKDPVKGSWELEDEWKVRSLPPIPCPY
jgi:nucleoporin SEH1